MAKTNEQQAAAEKAPEQAAEASVKYVMMKRIADDNGPHPIHPDEVVNYQIGGWRVVE